MSRTLRRFAAAILIGILAPGRGHALDRSGSMRWRFDDITVRDPSGTRRRSAWFQGYNLDLAGRLFHPAVGNFRTGGAYAQGADLNQAVNIDSSDRRTIDYKASAELLSPFIRRYIRFDPNYSLSQLRIGPYGGRPDHTIITSGWGFSSGLSIPKLPAISVARQYNTVKDADGPNPTSQNLNLKREDLSYQLGRVRFEYSHERRRTEDRLNLASVPEEDTQRGSVEYNQYDFKKLGLQSVSVRTDYLRLAAGGTSSVKSISNTLSLRSQDLRAGAWTHTLSYWNNAQRDQLAKTSLVSHNAQLNSARPLTRGNLTNNLTGNATNGRGGGSRSVATSPGVTLSFRDGRVATTANASVGGTRGGDGAKFLNDALEGRLSLNPLPVLGFFAEGRTSGNTPFNRDGVGGTRTNRYGAGGNRRFGASELSLRYDRAAQRDLAQGTRTVNDQVNLLGSGNPLERLSATGGFSYNTTKTYPGARYDSRNYRLGLDYYFRWGLQLSADTSFAARDQYTANFNATYALGKTSLTFKFQQQELPSRSSYSYMSIGLTRLL
ncbi:MAG: hypothetical protein HYX59_01765 [Elusimicrobia bacterium]|nr:hypothetical protein [Elusimicrobiota bacterium]